MLQVRPVFVREAALLLAELAGQAEPDGAFARALEARGAGVTRAGHMGPQPDRVAGFRVHALLPDGPEGSSPGSGFAAYAARLAGRVAFEGPVAGLSLSV